jgi:hypothetical protein
MTANPYDITAMNDEGGPAPGDPAASTGDARSQRKGAGRARMARGNLLLVLLFLAGGAVVYGLSRRKAPAEATADQQIVEAQVDGVIDRFTKVGAGGAGQAEKGQVTRALLQSFYAEIAERQVPLRKLKKDPFVFVLPATAQPMPGTGRPGSAHVGSAADDAQEQTVQEAEARFHGLHLQSIMMGQHSRQATAIISNNLVTVGQTVEGFTIKSINPKAVVLSWQGRQFVLEMR